MAESILRLRVNSEEYDNKLKRATEGLTRYAEQCRKAGGTLQYVDDGVLEFTRSLGKMDTVATTTRGKLAELTKTYTELSVQYRQMTDEEKKGEYGKALAASLDQLRGRIQSSKQELDDINKSINGGGGLTSSLDNLAGKFGLSIKQLTGWGAAIAAAKGALDVAKDAFFQSESNIDEWGRTLEGAKGAYNVFLDTLNNGNWSSFFKNLETAIRGGRDLYDALDRLGSIKSNNAAAIAIVQQQIAQLRLAKQQGKDVDDQLKAATARLAALQKQSIQAGKAAGNQTAFNVIRNGVNSIGGARVNDATIRLAVDQLMTGGQAQFDKFQRNYQILRRKGTRTVVQQLDDGMGGTVNRYRQTFDINTLTREEQKQYKIARAITEGETRIQEGISAFAQAVNEGTSAAREEFRGNRYALQGSGGKGGTGGSGGGNNEPDLSKVPFDINKAALAATKGIEGGPSDVFTAYKDSLKEQTDTTNDLIEAFKTLNKAEGVDTNKQKPEPQGEYKSFSNEMANITQGVSGIVSGIEQLGIEIPQGLKSLLGGIQAVAGILTGISALVTIITAIQGTKAVPVIGWMLSHGGVVPHAANGYYVPGTHASGDVTPIMANAGELVLNKSSQGNLANDLKGAEALVQTIDRYQTSIMRGSQYSYGTPTLDGGMLGNMKMEAMITGEQIRLVLNNNGRRTGRGEYVQTTINKQQ